MLDNRIDKHLIEYSLHTGCHFQSFVDEGEKVDDYMVELHYL